MFNMVMGIVMTVIGVVSVARAFFTTQMAGYIFFGMLMIGFGIVEMVRSRGVRRRKQQARDREFDMYTMIASQMGVKINPVTGEVLETTKNPKENKHEETVDDEIVDKEISADASDSNADNVVENNIEQAMAEAADVS